MMAARFTLLVVLLIYHKGGVRGSCDCNLNVASSAVGPEIIDSKLKSQQSVIDSLQARYLKLVEDNDSNLDRMLNAPTEVKQNIDLISDKIKKCEKKQHFQCIDSGECIHQLLGCDGVVDCIDGSDEANKTCDNPVIPGKTFTAVLPKTQQCIPDAASYVKLVCKVTKIERSSHFPQVFQGIGTGEYSFKDNDGRDVEGILRVKLTYYVASGETIWNYSNEKYRITGYAFVPYFHDVSVLRGAYYFGDEIKDICSEAIWY